MLWQPGWRRGQGLRASSPEDGVGGGVCLPLPPIVRAARGSPGAVAGTARLLHDVGQFVREQTPAGLGVGPVFAGRERYSLTRGNRPRSPGGRLCVILVDPHAGEVLAEYGRSSRREFGGRNRPPNVLRSGLDDAGQCVRERTHARTSAGPVLAGRERH